MVNCVNAAQSCFMGCGFDMNCPTTCQAEAVACMNSCMTSCNVSATCKDALGKLNACEEQNDAVCGEVEDYDACSFDKCCTEWKGAF